MITIICYNSVERWKSKTRALSFYKNGIACCDGIEKERYANIVCDILDGRKVCTDGYLDYYGADIKTMRHHKFPNGTDIRDLNGKIEYPIC